MAGTVLPFKALLDKDRIDSLSATCDESCAEGVTEWLPGCSELSHVLLDPAKVRVEKRTSLGVLPVVSHVCSPFAIPPLLSTLIVVLPPPPLQWRGGILHELFKNKGSTLDGKCYRDTILEDISGKCVSKYIRSCVLPFARLICGNLQFGSGFDGGETCSAHLHIRLIFDYCKFHKKSAAFAFIDISTAFAVLLRRAIFN